jgi:hypothetical protein
MNLEKENIEELVQKINEYVGTHAKQYESRLNTNHIKYNNRDENGALLVPKLTKFNITEQPKGAMAFKLEPASKIEYTPVYTENYILRVEFTLDELKELYSSRLLMDYVLKTMVDNLNHVLLEKHGISTEDTTIGGFRGVFMDASRPNQSHYVISNINGTFEIRLISSCAKFNY